MAGAGVRQPRYFRMNQKMFLAALVLSAPLAGFVASGCGDDEELRAEDAGTFEGGTVPEASPLPDRDGGDGVCPPSAGARPARRSGCSSP